MRYLFFSILFLVSFHFFAQSDKQQEFIERCNQASTTYSDQLTEGVPYQKALKNYQSNVKELYEFYKADSSLHTYINANSLMIQFTIAQENDLKNEFQPELDALQADFAKGIAIQNDQSNVASSSVNYFTAANKCLEKKDYVCAEENLIAQENLILENYERNSEKHLELITYQQLFYNQIGDYYKTIQLNKNMLSIIEENPDVIADEKNPYLNDEQNVYMSRDYKITYKKLNAYLSIGTAYWMLRNYELAIAYHKKGDSLGKMLHEYLPSYQPQSITETYMYTFGKHPNPKEYEQRQIFYFDSIVHASDSSFKKLIDQGYYSQQQYDEVKIGFETGQFNMHSMYRAADYHEIFRKVMQPENMAILKRPVYGGTTLYQNTLLQYASACTRDGLYEEAFETWKEVFNEDYLKEITFAATSMGESDFILYYNAHYREPFAQFLSFNHLLNSLNHGLAPECSKLALNHVMFIKAVGFRGSAELKESLREGNSDLFEDWQEMRKELNTLFSSDGNDEKIKSLSQEIGRTERKLAQLSGDSTGFSYPNWNAIQKKLGTEEAIVEIVKMDVYRTSSMIVDSSIYAAYVFDKTTQFPKVVYLKNKSDVLENAFFKTYFNGIQYRIKDEASFNNYWSDIDEVTAKYKRLYISNDGIYHLVNVGSLLSSRTGSYVASSQELKYIINSNRELKTSKKIKIHNATFFGRPTYSKDQKIDSTKSTRSLQGLHDSDISDLPGTEEEVLAASQYLSQKGVETQVYIQDNAEEEKLYDLHGVSVLHIATHGFYHKSKPNEDVGFSSYRALMNSGLLFSGVSEFSTDQSNDGILTAFEVEDLDLKNTELVVLSACQTGQGDLGSGQGIFGLKRAFLMAGANYVITSLWKVDDKATSKFMITFYETLSQDASVQNAFDTAVIETRKEFSHPYYWAPFILTQK